MQQMYENLGLVIRKVDNQLSRGIKICSLSNQI